MLSPESELEIGTTIHDERVFIRRSPRDNSKWGLFLDDERTGTADTFEGQLVRAAALVPLHRRAPGLPSPLIAGDEPPAGPDPKALDRALELFLQAQKPSSYDVKAEGPDFLEIDVWHGDGDYTGRFRVAVDGTAERIDLAGRARAAADDPGSGTLGRLYRIYDRLREARPDTYRDDFQSVLGALMDAGPAAANARLGELLAEPPAPSTPA